MAFETHCVAGATITEIISDPVILNSAEEGLDLTGDLYFQGFDKVILNAKNISSDFFDPKTGLAGDVLQKF
ncbi:DUF4180 domain-containing protein [Algoriphagus jejuensis]